MPLRWIAAEARWVEDEVGAASTQRRWTTPPVRNPYAPADGRALPRPEHALRGLEGALAPSEGAVSTARPGASAPPDALFVEDDSGQEGQVIASVRGTVGIPRAMPSPGAAHCCALCSSASASRRRQ